RRFVLRSRDGCHARRFDRRFFGRRARRFPGRLFRRQTFGFAPGVLGGLRAGRFALGFGNRGNTRGLTLRFVGGGDACGFVCRFFRRGQTRGFLRGLLFGREP